MSQKVSRRELKQMAYVIAAETIELQLSGSYMDNLARKIAFSHIPDEDTAEVAADEILGFMKEISQELRDRAEEFGGFF